MSNMTAFIEIDDSCWLPLGSATFFPKSFSLNVKSFYSLFPFPFYIIFRRHQERRPAQFFQLLAQYNPVKHFVEWPSTLSPKLFQDMITTGLWYKTSLEHSSLLCGLQRWGSSSFAFLFGQRKSRYVQCSPDGPKMGSTEDWRSSVNSFKDPTRLIVRIL